MKTPKTKVCTKCGMRKPIEEYSQDRRYSFKKKCLIWCKKTQCRECVALYKKIYNQVNRERLSKRAKIYHKEHKEEISIKKKQYRLKNKEKIATYPSSNRTYIEIKTRKEELAEMRHRLFLAEHKEKQDAILKEKLRSYKKAISEKRKKRRKKWEQINKYKIEKRKNDPAVKERRREVNQRYIKTLPDSYIRNQLRRGTILANEDIPQELIEIKREYIKLSRKLRKAQ